MHRGDTLHIGLDGYNLALPQGTGVATYGRVLGETLVGMGHRLDGVFGLRAPGSAPEALREVLFFGALDEAAAAPTPPTLRARLRRGLISPLPRQLVEAPLQGVVSGQGFEGRLPRFDRLLTYGGLFSVAARYFRRYGRFMPVRASAPPQVMHWTYPVPVRLVGARNVYTLHDLIPLRLPHTSTEDKRYHYRLLQGCLAQGEHICTVSQSSRRDILAMFPATEPARVVNTYQAVAPQGELGALDDAALAARLRALFDLEPQGYFLFFGALEPKKNLGRLIEAYLSAEVETPLVIVGARGWKAEGELRLLNGAHGAALPGLARIRRLDYLPRRLLLTLVRGARAVLFPSLYEGFGLPAAEALALGAPVLTSVTSSLPEIVGEAALTVDPYDVAALVEAIRRLDRDDALRRRLGEAGPLQARQFSPDAYAQRLAAFYQAVLAAPPRPGRRRAQPDPLIDHARQAP